MTVATVEMRPQKCPTCDTDVLMVPQDVYDKIIEPMPAEKAGSEILIESIREDGSVTYPSVVLENPSGFECPRCHGVTVFRGPSDASSN